MPDRGRLLLGAYAATTRLLAPFAPLLLRRRLSRGHEDPVRWRERLAAEPALPIVVNAPASPGAAALRPVWIHAASVGETVAALPLVEALARRGLPVLLTTVTVTSAGVAAARLPAGAVHRYAPLDLAPVMARFLARWQPRLAILVESELWPVTLRALAAAGTPVAVVNARVSARSAARWGRVPVLARALFGRLTLVLAQSEADAGRFAGLGAPDVRVSGNLKFAAPAPEAGPAAAAALAVAIGARPVLLAASTHPGEDEIVLDALTALRRTLPALLLMLAPRHPERGAAVAEMATFQGFVTARRSLDALPAAATDVYVADTIGELGTLYRLATLAFVGGSLGSAGGHNPIEPAALGTPIVAGPHTANFAEIYAALIAAGGVAIAADARALAAVAGPLLADPGERRRQAAAARAAIAPFAGALHRTLAALAPLLEETRPGARPAPTPARRAPA